MTEMTDPRSFHPNAATPLTDAEASAGRTPADDEVASADAGAEARFVAALQRLVRARRRDQLTALRQPLDLLIGWGALESPAHTRAAVERLLWVMPWLGDDAERLSQQRLAEFALVGALFALYSTYRPNVRLVSQRGSSQRGSGHASVPSVSPVSPVSPVSFGATWRRLMLLPGRDGAERQFASLLRAPRDELPRLLRHAIGILAVRSVPVDWITLLIDLAAWDADDRRVQRAWARDFWHRDPFLTVAAAATTPPSTALGEIDEVADEVADEDMDENAVEDVVDGSVNDEMG